MHKSKLIWVLALGVVLQMAGSRLLATGTVAPQEGDKEIVTGLVIRNPYNLAVSFTLRRPDGRTKNCRLGPGAERIFKDYDHIWIYSERGTKEYSLRNEGRYVFHWDRYAGLWDLLQR